MLLAVTFGVMMIVNVLPENAGGFVAPPLITLATLGLLYGYRRLTGRPPWAGLGLTRTWLALPQAVLGAVVGVAALLAGCAVTVWTGAAAWGQAVAAPPPMELVAGFALIVLRASFPEELLFRGHLWDVLSDRLGPRAVLVVTSVSFGLLHLFSQSPASGAGEKVLFMVQAIALFLLCGATRQRTGAIWTAVGVHTAIYLGQFIPIRPTDYGVQLAFQTVTLALAAVLVLAVRRPGSGPRAALPDARPDARPGLIR
ncbi:CPBP family intramembrane glutamic endopeptidase [Nonomuraea thailandensis]